MSVCEKTRRHFTEAAREAASLARQRKREHKAQFPEEHQLVMGRGAGRRCREELRVADPALRPDAAGRTELRRLRGPRRRGPVGVRPCSMAMRGTFTAAE